MSDNFGSGGVQTLGKRKAQQNKPQLMQGVIKLPNGEYEYDEKTLNEKIREALGFDFRNLYKDDLEEDAMLHKTQFEKEEIILQRHQQCEDLKERLKYQLQQQMEQFKQENQQAAQSIKQQRVKTQDQYSDSESSQSDYSDGDFSSASESKRKQKYDQKREQKTRRADKSESEDRSYHDGAESSDNDFSVQNDKDQRRGQSVQKRQKPKAPTQTVPTTKPLVENVEEMQKIILKRSKLEQWIDQLYYKVFDQTVEGCFVKVAYQKHYRLAEIYSTREDGPSYELGNKRTTIQLNLKYGEERQWFKMNLISNQDATETEFKNMIFKRQQAKDNPLTIDKVEMKIAAIDKAKKFHFDHDQVEETINKNFEKKIKEGKLNFGFNLSQQKIELKDDIGTYKQKLREAKEPALQREYTAIIETLQIKLQKIEEALKFQMEKNKNYFKTIEQGQEKVLTIEELEKKQAADMWKKEQEYYMKHPEKKKNNYFMKQLTRGDSVQQEKLEESERQKAQIQQELEQIRLRQQASFGESKKETYYEKMERMKREFKDFHENLKFSFDDKLKEKFGIQQEQRA